MRDLSRPALLIALGLLFVLLTSMGPGFAFGISLSGASRWFLIGLLVYFAMNCCGARGCRSRCRCHDGCTCGGCCCAGCKCESDEDEDDA